MKRPRFISKFPNKAIFSVDEASSFVLDDNISSRLGDGQLPEAEKPKEPIFKAEEKPVRTIRVS
jgi:hypothetical protein